MGNEGLPKDFFRMTRRQAQAYLDDFVDELPASRDRLAHMARKAGADPGWADDHSPASLGPLWEVATTSWDLFWQSAYVPGPSPAHPPVQQPTLEALGPLEALPSWFRHGPTHYLRFSPATLWVVDVLGRHLGQCLVAARADVEWVPGPGAPHHHSHEKGWPLVGDGTAWASPLSAVAGLVSRHISGGVPHTSVATLRDAFEVASERFAASEPMRSAEITVEDLVGLGALEVRTLDVQDPDDRELVRRGFGYAVWVGDEARLFYDDDAPLGLDSALAAHPCVDAVEQEDREVFYVQAPGLSRDEVLAAVKATLRDPRVRSAP